MAKAWSQHVWRIALDTASFITGVRSERGAARELLQLVIDERLTIVLDYKLLREYQAVALRTEHLQASRLSFEEMSEFIQTIADYAEPIEAVGILRPISSDPNDDMVLELAVAASVDAIVTTNKRHFIQATRSFGILVMTPGELLARIGRKPA